MTMEIVEFPIEHGDLPSFFVCLPGRVSTKLAPPGYALRCPVKG